MNGQTVMALWRRMVAIEGAMERSEVADKAAAVQEVTALEESVLRAPISSAEDALAVLFAVGLTAVRGERNDELDAEAYARACAWFAAA